MIKVTLKEEVKEAIKALPNKEMGKLMGLIDNSEKNILLWIKNDTDKLIRLDTLLAISEVLEKDVYEIVNIEK